MADSFSKQKRSQIVAAIKSNGNNSTEMKMISIFRANEIFGWRRNQKINGNPDFVFRKERIVLFVDGCFWHGCPIHCRKPNSNREYWHQKIARNQRRDVIVRKKLRKTGWRVLRIWEHELKFQNLLVKRIKSIL